MENTFSIFVDLGDIFPNFLMPGVQQFLGGAKRKRDAVRRQSAPTPFFEMVPGVGMVEHW
jgi:hypothetical protein